MNLVSLDCLNKSYVREVSWRYVMLVCVCILNKSASGLERMEFKIVR